MSWVRSPLAAPLIYILKINHLNLDTLKLCSDCASVCGMVRTHLNIRKLRPGVYVIGSSEHGYKVGYSRFARAHLKRLSRTLPFAVSVLGFWHLVWPNNSRQFNPARMKRELHALLAQKKIRGEWYRLSESEIESLDNLIHGLAREFQFKCSREGV
jgi:hypothetical protein